MHSSALSYDHGRWTAHGDVFDIGNATSQALERVRRGVPAEEAGGQDEASNGNGSLMRILPVVFAEFGEATAVFSDKVHRASSVTHGHPRSQMASSPAGSKYQRDRKP